MPDRQEATKTRTAAPPSPTDLRSPSLYVNREISLLQFQERVLAQASDTRHPLLDRVRSIAFVSKNLDEILMTRFSDLTDQIEAGIVEPSPDGMTPVQTLAAMRTRINALFKEQRRVLNDELLPALAAEGVHIARIEDLSVAQRAGLRMYFQERIFPVITPLAVDHGHPFPHISNLSVNLAVELQGQDDLLFARVKIPDVINRLIHVESILGQKPNGKKPKFTFVWLDDLVSLNLSALFPGVPVLACHQFRVIRDAEIEIREEEGADLRVSVERSLRQRRFGEPIALQVDPGMPDRVRAILRERLGVAPDGVYVASRPLGLASLMELTSIDRPDLKYPRFVPRLPPAMTAGENLLEVIDRHDVVLYHPYESFAPIVDLLEASARDPEVLAIKQTLYRVGKNSPVVQALLDAVNRGKQVAALIELKAKFDEESNLEWARELERAGVHVVYGFIGLKTHAKVALIVRQDRSGIKRYVHVGTGNYNPETARAYTDIGLLTCDPDFGADATDLFNYLTGYSQQTTYRRFLVAPINARAGLIERIDREIELHKRDGKGHLIFKMNSLADRESMEALYRASCAGVKVDLIVRGLSAIRPGVPGVSETMRVVSVVGRFLEHSRIYYFRNGGNPEVYAGSADLLTRNLDHRVEVLFPILDKSIRDHIVRDVLEAQLRDTANAWNEQADGSYVRVRPKDGEAPFDSMAWTVTADL